jgi:hypothetical protein
MELQKAYFYKQIYLNNMKQPVDYIKRIINKRVLLHSTFWISILMTVFITENWENPGEYKFFFFCHYLLAFIIFIIVSYFNLYFLIPKYFKNKRFLRYSLWLVFVLIGGAASILVLNYGFHYLIKDSDSFNPHSIPDHKHFTVFYFFHVMFGEAMFLISTFFFFIMEEWIRFQGITIKLKEIESQKVHSELQALKAQINPHFLFNTLNNIYSHSLDHSPKTSEMIMKLSELMSYILYECHDEKVEIQSELKFIKNYIELEKLRFEDLLQVELNISEANSHEKIVPLIFIAFIENAFKHVGHKMKNKQYVKVDLLIEPNLILLKVVNSINGQARATLKESGIGIENVRKRLEMLYPDKHTLEILKTEEEFKVELTIKPNGA